MMIELKDIRDPALDVYARLTENRLRNRLEPEKGIFIAQTPKVILLALEAGCEPVSLLMEDGPVNREARLVLDRIGELSVYRAPRALLEQLTGYALTRGMLCAMRRPVLPSVEALCRDARRIAVLDGVADATNVGAIVRSAAALGLDGLIVTGTCCDPLNRRAVRVSMGTLFQIPWTRADDWQTRLRAMGFATAAMALRPDALSPDDPILGSRQRLALVLGSEGWGLPEKTVAECDYTVCIPMRPGVDSLNVAAAAAVAFWELAKAPGAVPDGVVPAPGNDH